MFLRVAMHRVLFRIGRFSLHSWGVMVAFGFFVGLLAALRRAKKAGFPQKHIYDLAVVLIIAAIAGSRLWYVATHIDEFRGHWLDVINPFQGGSFGIAGMAMVGGVFCAVISAAVFCAVKRINFWQIADIVAPTFLLGMFFGRWGCFLNGCCFGRPTSLPWGVVFPPGSPAGNTFPGVRLHPTQIYEALIDLIFFLAVTAWEKRGKRFSGQSFWVSFFLYGVGRAAVDYWRWYEPQEVFVRYLGGNLSIHGFIVLCVALLCAVMAAFGVGGGRMRS